MMIQLFLAGQDKQNVKRADAIEQLRAQVFFCEHEDAEQLLEEVLKRDTKQ